MIQYVLANDHFRTKDKRVHIVSENSVDDTYMIQVRELCLCLTRGLL